VAGVTLLERHLRLGLRFGAARIVVVVGHLGRLIEAEVARVAPGQPVQCVWNRAYRSGSIVSLQRGLRAVERDLIVMDADVLYDPAVLRRLFETAQPSCVLVDTTSQERGEEMMVGVRQGRACRIARRVSQLGPWDAVGESVGFARIGGPVVPGLRRTVAETIASGGPEQDWEQALDRFFDLEPVGGAWVAGLAWTEIDFAQDLRLARERIAPRLPPL
jgi:choline kinase